MRIVRAAHNPTIENGVSHAALGSCGPTVIGSDRICDVCLVKHNGEASLSLLCSRLKVKILGVKVSDISTSLSGSRFVL